MCDRTHWNWERGASHDCRSVHSCRGLSACDIVRRIGHVLSIASVSVALGVELVRKGLGFESNWDSIVSDEATSSVKKGFFLINASISIHSHRSSNESILTLKV